MSIYKLDTKALFRQIKVNQEEKQLEWEPEKLEDNIFELLGIIQNALEVRTLGSPFLISERKYAIHFCEKNMKGPIEKFSKLLQK